MTSKHSAAMPVVVFISIVIVLGAISTPSAAATVDLLSPASGNQTGNTTVTFEYYASMPGLTSCTVNVWDGSVSNNFPDGTLENNAINTVIVQSTLPGSYIWNVTCSGNTSSASTTESSASRTFTVDTNAPTLAVVMPSDSAIVKNISIDIIPNDDITEYLACEAKWKDVSLETFNVQRNTHYAKSYSASSALSPGSGNLTIDCVDGAGNTISAQRTITYSPDFGLWLSLDKAEYGLREQPKLVIDTIDGANVSVDICPNQGGFVQCTTAIISGDDFPQMITLPYMNRTGSYLVDGIAIYGAQTKANQTTYSVINTMSVSVTASTKPRVDKNVSLTASVSGGVAPYRFVWRLHNGTVINDASVVIINYHAPGSYVENVTAYDYANNTKSTNYTAEILPLHNVNIKVFDKETGYLIVGAALVIQNDATNDKYETKTVAAGGFIELEDGHYRMLASMEGYAYNVVEVEVNQSIIVSMYLERDSNAPRVTISSPQQDEQVGSPVTVSYSVKHNAPMNCTLMLSQDGSWYTPNGTMRVTGPAVQQFTRDIPQGQRWSRIECADDRGKTGASTALQFTVSQYANPTDANSGVTATNAEDISLQESVDRIDQTLQLLEGYGQKEKEASSMLGFDRQLRNTKKALMQAIRDINDLQYRQDMDADARVQEHKKILDNTKLIAASTPIGLTVVESKTYIKYPKEEEMPDIASQLSGKGGMTSDAKSLSKLLAKDQQKFTVSTRLMHVEYAYPDKTTKIVSVVQKTLTYAPNLSKDYKIIDIIPKEVISSAKDIQFITAAEVLKDDPIIRFDQQQSITYVLPKRADMSRLETIKTILVLPYAGDANSITGFAVWTGQGLDELSLPVVILLCAIVIAYLIYYFDIIKHLRFLVFKTGKKNQVHYLRVMINDASDQLAANNYEKAEMLYKEVRLSYDQMPEYGKNELYDDIMEMVHKMDAYYFNMVMIELDNNLKMGDMRSAIASYEKLTKVFERLDAAHQEQLIMVVTAMGKRMGLGMAHMDQGATGATHG